MYELPKLEMDHDRDKLTAKLQTWKTHVEVPRRFRGSVWGRIAAREDAQRTSRWSRLRDAVFTGVVRPAYATALIVGSISFSLGLAHVQAASENTKHWKELEARYLRSITPTADGTP